MKTFTPTDMQIRLAQAVFTTMANEALIRPKVEAYQKAILAKHQWHIDPEKMRRGAPDEIILDPNLSYLLTDADFDVYHAECQAAREAAGLKVDNPDNCPLLVAEWLRIQAENALLDAMSVMPEFEGLKEAVHHLKLRDEAVEITLRLLAPFVGSAADCIDQILGG